MQKSKQYLSLVIVSIGLVACNSGGSSPSVVSSGWTLIGGSTQVNLSQNSTSPAARNLSVSWTDKNGNMWLFGGDVMTSSSESQLMNDLWMYNPSNKTWTQINSSQSGINIPGSYGIKNQVSSSNYPGARMGGITWTDNSGNLWLFGGFGYATNSSVPGALNDLWELNPSNNQWTWVSGESSTANSGVYGVKNLPDNLSHPGARLGSVSWSDNSGNLWLFGGDSDLINQVDYNDLWKYSITNNQWTWVSGESSTGASGIYGVQTVPNPKNMPGARLDSVGWVDESGNLWLFGGNGKDGIGSIVGDLNDLWRFNPTDNVWTWMSGSNMSNKYGVYGTQNVSSPNAIPGARMHRIPIAWTDAGGNFWMFGGDGYGRSTQGLLNDLWKYNPNNNQWTWVNGSNESGVFSTANNPGSRRDSIGWINQQGQLVILGGYGYSTSAIGMLSDMWQLNY